MENGSLNDIPKTNFSYKIDDMTKIHKFLTADNYLTYCLAIVYDKTLTAQQKEEYMKKIEECCALANNEKFISTTNVIEE